MKLNGAEIVKKKKSFRTEERTQCTLCRKMPLLWGTSEGVVGLVAKVGRMVYLPDVKSCPECNS